MPRTQTIKVTVPDDADDPVMLVDDALERLVGKAYPVWLAPLDDEIPQSAIDGAIVIEAVTEIKEN